MAVTRLLTVGSAVADVKLGTEFASSAKLNGAPGLTHGNCVMSFGLSEINIFKLAWAKYRALSTAGLVLSSCCTGRRMMSIGCAAPSPANTMVMFSGFTPLRRFALYEAEIAGQLGFAPEPSPAIWLPWPNPSAW